MLKKKNVLVILSIMFILFFTVGGYFIEKKHREKVISMPQKYCYETFRNNGRSMSVIMIKDLDLKNDYLDYYNELKSGTEPILPNSIPLKGLPQYSPVYVMGYSKDSLLADVVTFFDYGNKRGGSYTRGWVLAECLHDEAFTKAE